MTATLFLQVFIAVCILMMVINMFITSLTSPNKWVKFLSIVANLSGIALASYALIAGGMITLGLAVTCIGLTTAPLILQMVVGLVTGLSEAKKVAVYGLA